MRYFSQHTHLTLYKVGLSVGQPSELHRTFVGKMSDFRRTQSIKPWNTRVLGFVGS